MNQGNKTLEFKFERTIAAPPSAVFDAWLDTKVPGNPWHAAEKLVLDAKVDGPFYWAHKNSKGVRRLNFPSTSSSSEASDLPIRRLIRSVPLASAPSSQTSPPLPKAWRQIEAGASLTNCVFAPSDAPVHPRPALASPHACLRPRLSAPTRRLRRRTAGRSRRSRRAPG